MKSIAWFLFFFSALPVWGFDPNVYNQIQREQDGIFSQHQQFMNEQLRQAEQQRIWLEQQRQYNEIRRQQQQMSQQLEEMRNGQYDRGE